MVEDKVIYLDDFRQMKERRNLEISSNLKNTQSHPDIDEEERIKTLDLFMKVIATMYKESYK